MPPITAVVEGITFEAETGVGTIGSAATTPTVVSAPLELRPICPNSKPITPIAMPERISPAQTNRCQGDGFGSGSRKKKYQSPDQITINVPMVTYQMAPAALRDWFRSKPNMAIPFVVAISSSLSHRAPSGKQIGCRLLRDGCLLMSGHQTTRGGVAVARSFCATTQSADDQATSP